MKNFKTVGRWWNDKSIELVKIDGRVYALNNWDGDIYSNCWECLGDHLMNASEEEYSISPIYEEIEGEYEIIGYEVYRY